MLAKLNSVIASIDSKLNKPLCILLGLVVGYIGHPLITLALDIAKIPFKLIGLL